MTHEAHHRTTDENVLLAPVLRTTWKYVAVVGLLACGFATFVLVWGYQIVTGIGVAGINRPVAWGVYITNFVFWVGISHAGTLTSAFLHLTHADWRRPITRAAEAMTVFALMIAGLFPLVHLGRVWVFYYMIPYPNTRTIWPNYRSPLPWDMTAIFTYLTGSSLFLFLGAIPDFALLRDRTSGWPRRIYSLLSFGWRGTQAEWRRLRAAFGVMTVVIIPVFVSVHTIVSWDFGMSIVPHWHTIILAPYFVIGAVLSGVSAVITLMILLRRAFRLEEYLTPEHFDNIGKILLAASLMWTYFYGMDLWAALASGVPEDWDVLRFIVQRYPHLLVIMLVCNVVLPAPLLAFRKVRRHLPTMLVLTLIINVGMWLERYLIIVPSLSRGRITWGQYGPTWVELSITFGTLATFGLLYTLFTKVAPILSVWEIREGREQEALRLVGDREVETTVKETVIG